MEITTNKTRNIPVGNSGIEGDGETEVVGTVPKGMYWELSDNP
jgi:hypothetical protein